MFFGFSVGDVVIALVRLSTQTYRSWEDGCGEYTEITCELSSLKIVLERVAAEAKIDAAHLVIIHLSEYSWRQCH